MPSYRNLSSREQYDAAKARTTEHNNMIKDIVRQLTYDEQESINKAVMNIIDQHRLKTNTDGFIYKGNIYPNSVNPRTMKRAPLHPDLMNDWMAINAEQESLNKDKTRLTQGIAVLLRNIHDNQGVRDALPEPLVKILDGGRLLSYPRTRPELFSLTSKLHLSQFEDVKELIFFYLSSRLLSE